MIYGDSSVEVYSAVEGGSIDPSNSTQISGPLVDDETVITGGIRFSWSYDPTTGAGGFTGVGWFANDNTTPIGYSSYYNNEEALEAALVNGSLQNLNAIFNAWQSFVQNAIEVEGVDYVQQFTK